MAVKKIMPQAVRNIYDKPGNDLNRANPINPKMIEIIVKKIAPNKYPNTVFDDGMNSLQNLLGFIM